MATTLSCGGTITLNNQGSPLCDTGWILEPVFDISQLDPVTVAAYVGGGFFLLLPLWVAVIGGRALIQSIKV